MSKALSIDLRTRVLQAVADGASHRQAADITVEELRAALAEQGQVFGYGTLQRFFRRHAITRKKRPRTPASRSAPTS